ncbi:VOC family protein [Streptomyces sp. J2-1]|uniref:VOC family protein n=1 Tax=Streptomyces corallincola TaxID=2851888 RepID=UPI001C38CADF|nr:VOC family protein [Streptomyces corallincola]MBV2356002.1 VOC family protein [Streptomyces corallincola]
MLGTDFRVGSPVWLDLGSPDQEAAVGFYGAVFGWRYESLGAEAGGYGLFRLGGRVVAGIGPLTEEGAASAWTTYFRCADAEAAVRAVRAGGGEVRYGPVSLGAGTMAQVSDPEGARFAVLEGGGGLEVTSAGNALVWAELHSADPEAAIRFYQGLFGWRYADLPAPGLTYRVLSIAEGDQEDGTFGGAAPLQGEQGMSRWVPYFAVADADTVVTAVRAAGGTVLMPAADVPEAGRVALLTDPAGAVFAVLKPDPRQA